jgi:hypothetical protein
LFGIEALIGLPLEFHNRQTNTPRAILLPSILGRHTTQHDPYLSPACSSSTGLPISHSIVPLGNTLVAVTPRAARALFFPSIKKLICSLGTSNGLSKAQQHLRPETSFPFLSLLRKNTSSNIGAASAEDHLQQTSTPNN